MMDNRKSHTLAQKNLFIKHHKVRGILVDALPHSEYIKILENSTAEMIFKSPCDPMMVINKLKRLRQTIWFNSIIY